MIFIYFVELKNHLVYNIRMSSDFLLLYIFSHII